MNFIYRQDIYESLGFNWRCVSIVFTYLLRVRFGILLVLV